MANSRCTDLDKAYNVDGISTDTRPGLPILGSSCPKKRKGDLTTAATMPVSELNLEFKGLNWQGTLLNIEMEESG